jgi:hypothetical protein
MDAFENSNTGYPTIDGTNVLTYSLNTFTYDKPTIEQKIADNQKPLNETN